MVDFDRVQSVQGCDSVVYALTQSLNTEVSCQPLNKENNVVFVCVCKRIDYGV